MAITIGSINLNLHTVDREEVVYTRTGNTVSHTDLVTLRRTPATNPAALLKTNILFQRGFETPSTANTGLEKEAKLSIAMSVPPGANVAQIKAWIEEGLAEAAQAAATLAVSGDIHLYD